MIMITTILWDVDRTLLDFDAAESAAIRSLFAEFSFGECPEDKVHRYSAINERYWQRMERGEIDKNEVLVGRFREFLKRKGWMRLSPQPSTKNTSFVWATPSFFATTATISLSPSAVRCASLPYPTARSPRRRRSCACPASAH